MSKYYKFDRNKNDYFLIGMKENKRYMYDPVTDSYVENIRTTLKEAFLHTKYGHYGFHDFYTVFTEFIENELCGYEFRCISMGDYTFDEEWEILRGDKKIRYSPYAMFILSTSCEETIDMFLNMCEVL